MWIEIVVLVLFLLSSFVFRFRKLEIEMEIETKKHEIRDSKSKGWLFLLFFTGYRRSFYGFGSFLCQLQFPAWPLALTLRSSEAGRRMQDAGTAICSFDGR